jgi:hypothetical protein
VAEDAEEACPVYAGSLYQLIGDFTVVVLEDKGDDGDASGGPE